MEHDDDPDRSRSRGVFTAIRAMIRKRTPSGVDLSEPGTGRPERAFEGERLAGQQGLGGYALSWTWPSLVSRQ